MRKTLTDYTVLVRQDDNGTYVAYVPALDGCHAWGRTDQDARSELGNVFDMIAAEYAETRRPLPPDVVVATTRAG